MPASTAIRAVTFDVGGTLIAAHPSVGEIYAAVATRHHPSPLDPALLERRFRDLWRRMHPFGYQREDWERLVDAVFAGLLPEPPSRSFFPELYDAFAGPKYWRVFDDVVPTLEALAEQGIDLAIISNWDERLRPLLGALGLDRYFNSIVISCEAGFTKPSPVIFGEALRRLGRPASAVLHVGDALREDFAGATAAGLHALHLRRDAPSRDSQIQSLREIPQWLGIFCADD